MVVSLRDCRVCGKMLYLNPEKKSGVCDACRRAPPLRGCLKCARPLIFAAEKLGGLCQRCQMLQVRCGMCGKVVSSAREKQAARCNACGKEKEQAPRVRGVRR